MKINKILLIILILLIAVTTSSCNQSEKLTEPIEIHIQIFSSEGNADPTINKVYQDAAANFHIINPQITVTIDYHPTGFVELEDTLKYLESNQPQDIVSFMGTSDLSKAEKKGLILDLLPLQQVSGTNEIDIDQQILDLAMIKGKLLALPYGVDTSAVLYNKDLFDEAHIPYPQGDWTWEQFRAISNQLKSSDSILQYNPTQLSILMESYGKGVLSPDGDTSVGYLDSPEAIRTLQWLNAYYRDTKMNIPSGVNNAGKFIKSEVALIPCGIMELNIISTYASNINMGITSYPHFEDGKRANPINISGFGISQKSKHPEIAWKFIEYLTLTKNDDSIKFANGYLTSSKSMSKTTGQSTDPKKSKFIDELNYAVKSPSNYDLLYFKAWNEKLIAQFQSLLTMEDKEIPAKLHDLALKYDQELNYLKKLDDQMTESKPQ